MLLEIAIGDAYGAGFEFTNLDHISRNNQGVSNLRHPVLEFVPGNYTDDTQLAIAVAETIVSDDPWSVENLADRFVQVFKHDPRIGYSKWLYGQLQIVNSDKEFLAVMGVSRKNGATKRAAPIGVLSDVKNHPTCETKNPPERYGTFVSCGNQDSMPISNSLSSCRRIV